MRTFRRALPLLCLRHDPWHRSHTASLQPAARMELMQPVAFIPGPPGRGPCLRNVFRTGRPGILLFPPRLSARERQKKARGKRERTTHRHHGRCERAPARAEGSRHGSALHLVPKPPRWPCVCPGPAARRLHACAPCCPASPWPAFWRGMHTAHGHACIWTSQRQQGPTHEPWSAW